jgi:UDP-3-O-[3-hydroxymyristoyl] glucosamine N-acyltransferase
MRCTLGQLAEATGLPLRGDAQTEIRGLASLASAGPGELSFLANPRYARHLATTRAAAVILRPEQSTDYHGNALLADDPYVAYVRAAAFLNPAPAVVPGIHRSAVVAESARVAASAAVGPCAVIGASARIGEAAGIGPGCVIGEGAVVGRGSRLAANVTLCAGTVIGERALLHPGVVIGADGFGLANDDGKWLKIPQLGRVVIGNDVEIGANSCIDRGALDDTLIGDGVKIDNLVQIGHNVRIGAHTAIAGCAVIAGSVTIGSRCMIGGASALAGHIELADDVVISGMSGVPNSIRQAGVYSGGVPISDNRTWRRNMSRLRHLDELWRKVRALEQAVAERLARR